MLCRLRNISNPSPSLHLARVIDLPLPTNRLASAALRALQVDAELSPLVLRTFSLASRQTSGTDLNSSGDAADSVDIVEKNPIDKTVLRTEYRATTNRMLRVAVNGFMESLGVVLGIMEKLDVDVLATAR